MLFVCRGKREVIAFAAQERRRGSTTTERSKHMPVSLINSKLIFDALKECDIRLLSALPETWLVHLIRMTDEDPEMILVRLAKEEEGVGISALVTLSLAEEIAELRLAGGSGFGDPF